MKTRLLLTALSLLGTLSAAAQLSGTFYLEKTTFAPGEPIFLHFKVWNRGDREALLGRMGLPEQPVCAGYLIEISPDPPAASSRQKVPMSPFDSCALNGPLSVQPIEPGKSFTERILLNLDPELNVQGKYSIHAKYLSWVGGPESKLDAETTLTLRVGSAAPAAFPTKTMLILLLVFSLLAFGVYRTWSLRREVGSSL